MWKETKGEPGEHGTHICNIVYTHTVYCILVKYSFHFTSECFNECHIITDIANNLSNIISLEQRKQVNRINVNFYFYFRLYL